MIIAQGQLNVRRCEPATGQHDYSHKTVVHPRASNSAASVLAGVFVRRGRGDSIVHRGSEKVHTHGGTTNVRRRSGSITRCGVVASSSPSCSHAPQVVADRYRATDRRGSLHVRARDYVPPTGSCVYPVIFPRAHLRRGRASWRLRRADCLVRYPACARSPR